MSATVTTETVAASSETISDALIPVSGDVFDVLVRAASALAVILGKSWDNDGLASGTLRSIAEHHGLHQTRELTEEEAEAADAAPDTVVFEFSPDFRAVLAMFDPPAEGEAPKEAE